jgi:hypothetical protein
MLTNELSSKPQLGSSNLMTALDGEAVSLDIRKSKSESLSSRLIALPRSVTTGTKFVVISVLKIRNEEVSTNSEC